jgi:hypothetical protein
MACYLHTFVLESYMYVIFKSQVQIEDRHAPQKITSVADDILLQALQFQIPSMTGISHYWSNRCFWDVQLNVCVLNWPLLNMESIIITVLKALYLIFLSVISIYTNPSTKDYTRTFYAIYERDIPYVKWTTSLNWFTSMRSRRHESYLQRLSCFSTPPRLHRTEVALQLS